MRRSGLVRASGIDEPPTRSRGSCSPSGRARLIGDRGVDMPSSPATTSSSRRRQASGVEIDEERLLVCRVGEILRRARRVADARDRLRLRRLAAGARCEHRPRGRGAPKTLEATHPLRPRRGRAAHLRALAGGRAASIRRAGGHAGGELLDRDPAAERHRRAAHGPRAQRLDPGRADPHATACAGGNTHVDPRHRPRRHRDPGAVEKAARARRARRREELGREAFVERVWEWREQYGAHDHRAVQAARRLAATTSDERFTLDEGYVRAV